MILGGTRITEFQDRCLKLLGHPSRARFHAGLRPPMQVSKCAPTNASRKASKRAFLRISPHVHRGIGSISGPPRCRQSDWQTRSQRPVAARQDPCPIASATQRCRPSVQMLWQPLQHTSSSRIACSRAPAANGAPRAITAPGEDETAWPAASVSPAAASNVTIKIVQNPKRIGSAFPPCRQT